MGDGEKNIHLEKHTPRQSISSVSNVSTFLQSIWIRCRAIFPDITDRKFMESEFRFVLYCGLIFWFIYLLSKII